MVPWAPLDPPLLSACLQVTSAYLIVNLQLCANCATPTDCCLSLQKVSISNLWMLFWNINKHQYTTVLSTTNLAGSSVAISVFTGHAHYECNQRDKRSTGPSHQELIQAQYLSKYMVIITAQTVALKQNAYSICYDHMAWTMHIITTFTVPNLHNDIHWIVIS